MKRFACLLFVCSVVFGCDSNDTSLTLEEAAQDVNMQCPIDLDENTTLIKCYHIPPDKIVYTYETNLSSLTKAQKNQFRNKVINKLKDDVSKAQKNQIRTKWINKLKNDVSVNLFAKHNTTFIFEYFDVVGDTLFSFNVTPIDYNNEQINERLRFLKLKKEQKGLNSKENNEFINLSTLILEKKAQEVTLILEKIAQDVNMQCPIKVNESTIMIKCYHIPPDTLATVYQPTIYHSPILKFLDLKLLQKHTRDSTINRLRHEKSLTQLKTLNTIFIYEYFDLAGNPLFSFNASPTDYNNVK